MFFDIWGKNNLVRRAFPHPLLRENPWGRGWDKKIKFKNFKSGKSTVNALNALAIRFFLGNSPPPHLTPPPADPQVLAEWSLGQGETKMAPSLVQRWIIANQGMRKDSARRRSDLSVQWFINLWII